MLQPSYDVAFAAASDLDACRRLIRTGSKSFFAASLMLPRAVRRPAFALYAFCRIADDAVDVDADQQGAGRAEAVADLRSRLDRAYGRKPKATPVDRAFAHVVHAHAIPKALPEALLEGLAWDAQGRQYDDLSGVFDYSARVAGAVGAMMALLMGVRSPAAIARACDLGVAMQLTNIARDVADDARLGRLYLPRDWLHEQGVDPDAWLAAPLFDDRIRAVVARLLRVADKLYLRSLRGIELLPLTCRPGIHAARLIYAEIGGVLRAQAFDPSFARAFVTGGRKVQLVGAALLLAARDLGGRPRERLGAARSLPEVRFLVEAVLREQPPSLATAPVEGGAFIKILEICHLLDERDREHRISATRGYSAGSLFESGVTATPSL